jgi:hypothetical protein
MGERSCLCYHHALPLVLGLAHSLKTARARPIYFLVYGAFLGIVVEGWITDTEHWRHFDLLLAVVWGLMAGDRPIGSGDQPTHCIAGCTRL